jgi:glycosyltransferase involved in cell wall biosynthesis
MRTLYIIHVGKYLTMPNSGVYQKTIAQLCALSKLFNVEVVGFGYGANADKRINWIDCTGRDRWHVLKEWTREHLTSKDLVIMRYPWASRDLLDCVQFLGVMNREQVQSVFSNSCCFVQHSVVAENGDEEGTPVAIMKAMLAGLLVVSTRHAGIADVVPSNCGYLVEEHDVTAMADAMYLAGSSPELAQEMASNAREFILASHTSSMHLKQINDFIS